MDNRSSQKQSSEKHKETIPEPPSLTSIAINDETTALNILVQFVHIAQKRGAFNLQESAKLWEAISIFTKKE